MAFIKFLGTAGARFVMIKQLRSSGGIWLNHKSTNIIIDPGPGALVACNKSRPKLDPSSLEAIILTHKHLDHSGDVNVMVEAMTQGGHKKRGRLFVPADALGREGVVFSYLRKFPQETVTIQAGERFEVGDITFEVAARNTHSVETYGLKFFLDSEIISLVSDTKYSKKLADIYKDSTVLVLNVVFYEPRPDYDHLSIHEAIDIVKAVRPRKSVFTHFGMTMLRQKPYRMEKEIQNELQMNVQLAYDGYSLQLPLEE